MPKLLTCILALICTFKVQGQQPMSFSVKGGSYHIYQYDSNIYKIIFLPAGYKHYELLSDAVIKQPFDFLKNGSIEVQDASVIINNKKIISSYFSEDGFRGFHFPLQQNEKIYGAGERAISLDRRGFKLNLYNNPWYGYSEGADNLNYSVPFITSSLGYGLFFDNPSKSYLDIGKKNANLLQYGASSGELNVYVIFGNAREILKSYHTLTGTQPLPPRWAMGNLMSRFGYTSEAQVNSIYNKMQQYHIPVDAIIYDLFWFGDSIKNTMGNLEWVNRKKWPNPPAMIKNYKNKGVQSILVTEPFFVERSSNYKSSLPYLATDSLNKPYYLQDFYFGKGGLIDIFRKDARNWFWNFYKKQMNIGVEAWWGDLGEPEKHPEDMYHDLSDFGHKRLFAAGEVHNLYGHAWTKMLYENFEKYYPSKRLFSLNRSGFAGSQRFSIFPWTGDVSRSWSGYRSQLPLLLGMAMSGVPYVHSDAGGFAGGDGDQELYVRWLQFAAFTPIFRPHGTALYEVDTLAFSFPSEAALMDGKYREAAAAAIKMRYHFLSYNYNLSYLQAAHAEPLMAPMYYHFDNDTVASKLEDQYMWGENLLVAPVLQKQEKLRKYYLPAGRWYHLLNGKTLEGKKWYVDSVSLETFPLLAREGSFIPLSYAFSPPANTSFYSADSLLVVYVPSERSSTYRWFNDDGHSKNTLSENKFELLAFSALPDKNETEILISVKNAVKMKKRKLFLFLPSSAATPVRAEINGTEAGHFAFVVNDTFMGKGYTIPIDLEEKDVRLRIYWK